MKPVMKTKADPDVAMRLVTRSAIDAAELMLSTPSRADGEEKPTAMLISINMPSSKLPYTLRLLLSTEEGLSPEMGRDILGALRTALHPAAVIKAAAGLGGGSYSSKSG